MSDLGIIITSHLLGEVAKGAPEGVEPSGAGDGGFNVSYQIS